MRHQSNSKALATVQPVDEKDQPVGQTFQVEVNADKADDGAFDAYDVYSQCRQQTGLLGLALIEVVEA